MQSIVTLAMQPIPSSLSTWRHTMHSSFSDTNQAQLNIAWVRPQALTGMRFQPWLQVMQVSVSGLCFLSCRSWHLLDFWAPSIRWFGSGALFWARCRCLRFLCSGSWLLRTAINSWPIQARRQLQSQMVSLFSKPLKLISPKMPLCSALLVLLWAGSTRTGKHGSGTVCHRKNKKAWLSPQRNKC